MIIVVGQDYSRSEWKQKISCEVYGIEKDIIKDIFAPNLPHADFYIYESKDNMWIYGVTIIRKNWILGAKRIKILGKMNKIEFDKI